MIIQEGITISMVQMRKLRKQRDSFKCAEKVKARTGDQTHSPGPGLHSFPRSGDCGLLSPLQLPDMGLQPSQKNQT